MRALRVDISKLRPWEYDAMSFWDYARITHALDCWQESQRLFPRQKDNDKTLPPLPIRADGTGPQF